MTEVLKFLGFVVVGVVVPLALILGIYFGLLPAELKSMVGTAGTALAVVITVGFSVWLMWDDITTGRYSSSNYKG